MTSESGSSTKRAGRSTSAAAVAGSAPSRSSARASGRSTASSAPPSEAASFVSSSSWAVSAGTVSLDMGLVQSWG